MEIKSKKELLKIALDNFDEYYDISYGLCAYFRNLWDFKKIGFRDFQILKTLIHNEARIKDYLFNNIIYDKRRLINRCIYFWELNKEGTTKRKNYLQYLYEKA